MTRHYNAFMMQSHDIRTLRTSLRESQEAFAYRLGVTASTVSRWELGKKLPGKLSRLRLLTIRRHTARQAARQ